MVRIGFQNGIKSFGPKFETQLSFFILPSLNSSVLQVEIKVVSCADSWSNYCIFTLVIQNIPVKWRLNMLKILSKNKAIWVILTFEWPRVSQVDHIPENIFWVMCLTVILLYIITYKTINTIVFLWGFELDWHFVPKPNLFNWHFWNVLKH